MNMSYSNCYLGTLRTKLDLIECWQYVLATAQHTDERTPSFVYVQVAGHYHTNHEGAHEGLPEKRDAGKVNKKICCQRRANPGCHPPACPHWTTIDLQAARGPYRSAKWLLLKWDGMNRFIKGVSLRTLSSGYRCKYWRIKRVQRPICPCAASSTRAKTSLKLLMKRIINQRITSRRVD